MGLLSSRGWGDGNGKPVSYPHPTSQLARGQTLSVVNPSAVGRHMVAVRASCSGNRDDGRGGRLLEEGQYL